MGIYRAGRYGRVIASILLAGAVTSGLPVAGSAGALTAGRQTSQPIGHYEFCKLNPAECAIRPRDRRPVPMSSALWAETENVNVSVNRTIRPMNDSDIYGKDEVWAYPDKGVGDCEDYVLEKRRKLIAMGVPIADLLITVVRKMDGEGHAVLTLRTDRGDYILDNLTDTMKPWDHTGYRFIKRQATYDTGRWVSLVEDNNVLVGALK